MDTPRARAAALAHSGASDSESAAPEGRPPGNGSALSSPSDSGLASVSRIDSRPGFGRRPVRRSLGRLAASGPLRVVRHSWLELRRSSAPDDAGPGAWGCPPLRCIDAMHGAVGQRDRAAPRRPVFDEAWETHSQAAASRPASLVESDPNLVRHLASWPISTRLATACHLATGVHRSLQPVPRGEDPQFLTGQRAPRILSLNRTEAVRCQAEMEQLAWARRCASCGWTPTCRLDAPASREELDLSASGQRDDSPKAGPASVETALVGWIESGGSINWIREQICRKPRRTRSDLRRKPSE